jgi:hypothetical protein
LQRLADDSLLEVCPHDSRPYLGTEKVVVLRPLDRFHIEPEQALGAIQTPKEVDHLVLWLRSVEPDLLYLDLLSGALLSPLQLVPAQGEHRDARAVHALHVEDDAVRFDGVVGFRWAA